MEIVKISIEKDTLQMLVDSSAITTDEFTVIGVDEKDYDYSDNPLWIALKEKSNKAFKDLKTAEFKIRNGI
jgi:hypothetical protein